MKRKHWLPALLVAVLIWCSMAVVDFSRVHYFERPVFCLLQDGADDGGSGIYRGLGYSFEIEGNFMPEDEFPGVTFYSASVFGISVKEGNRD